MTTKKPNKLAAAFNKSTNQEPITIPATEQKKETSKTPSREGKKTAIVYIDPAGARELKLLSLDTSRSQQDLLVEAINDLLIKHGKKPLA
jgi:hypothetical protein